MKFENTPNWTLEVEETSMSVFRVSAVHNDGRSIEKTNNTPEATLEEVKKETLEMDALRIHALTLSAKELTQIFE